MDDNGWMGDSDPYRPPATELTTPVLIDAQGQVLASREQRLAAAMIDAAIAMLLIVPLQWKFGVYANPTEQTVLSNLVWGGVGIVTTLMVQGYWLATSAQSVGKLVMRIKIVTLDGKNADFGRIVLRRLLPLWCVSLIPLVGGFLSVIDTLWIFRKDQRCIHDHIAGTQVIKL